MSDNSAAARLYDMLDMLVALRMRFGTGVDAEEALEALGPFKMRDVLAMLDAAINSTKSIIGEQNEQTLRETHS